MEYFFGKVFNSFVIGIFIGFGYKFIKFYKFDRSHNNIMNKKETRLILTEAVNYSREYIIGLGKKAVRCPSTNKLFIHPVVKEHGISIENVDDESINENYSNRALKEFIEKCRSFYDLN
jgi:hypothetical protein